ERPIEEEDERRRRGRCREPQLDPARKCPVRQVYPRRGPALSARSREAEIVAGRDTIGDVKTAGQRREPRAPTSRAAQQRREIRGMRRQRLVGSVEIDAADAAALAFYRGLAGRVRDQLGRAAAGGGHRRVEIELSLEHG